MITCAVRRWDFFLGYSIHEGQLIMPPAPPVPLPMPHLSFGIVSGTQLFAQSTSCKHKSVLCDGVHLMGRLSDAFPVVPHITLPMIYQPMLPLTILFGSSMSCWGSGRVQMETYSPIFGNATADLATFLGCVVGPHLGCNETFTMPFDVAMATNTTCVVGMSWGDFAACLLDIAIQLAMEVVFKFGGDFIGSAFRRIKVAQKGGGKLEKAMKAKALFKKAEKEASEAEEKAAAHAASKAGSEAEDDAARKMSELDENLAAGKKGQAVAVEEDADGELVQVAEEAGQKIEKDADEEQTKLDEAAAEAKAAKNKAEIAMDDAVYQARDVTAYKKTLTKSVRESKSQLRKLKEARSQIEELFKDSPIRRKIELGQADAAIAARENATKKLTDKLEDLKSNSFSEIFSRTRAKAAKKSEEVYKRSEYISYKDYMKLYGSGSVDNKFLKYTGVYPAYKFLTGGGLEFLETQAAHSGSNLLYLMAHRAGKSLSKTVSRVSRGSSGSYSSDSKGIGYFSNSGWGQATYSRSDFIDQVDGSASSDGGSSSSAASTSRFAWVGDGATSAIRTTQRFTWADQDAAAAPQDHWADSTYVAGTTDRFGWVESDDSDSSST